MTIFCNLDYRATVHHGSGDPAQDGMPQRTRAPVQDRSPDCCRDRLRHEGRAAVQDRVQHRVRHRCHHHHRHRSGQGVRCCRGEAVHHRLAEQVR